MQPLPASVQIREVGPRDGLQIERPISLEDKLGLIEVLAATGVRRIEATAFVSARAVPAMADAEQVAQGLHRWPGITWSALVPSIRGAERAVAAGISNLEYVISAADAHSIANVGRNTAESVALIDAIAAITHQAGGTLEVIIATAWDCPFTGPTPVGRTVEVARQAAARGVDQLCLGDTIGTTTPGRVLDLLAEVREVAEGLDVGVHFHNTRGTGIANALAAVQAGVTSLDSSVGGLGGCPFAPGASGNIATEELVYMLEGCGIDTGVDLDKVIAAAQVAEKAVKHDLPSSLYRAGGRPRPLGEAVPATNAEGRCTTADPSPYERST